MAGKDKCEFLKGIRKRMAEANGIPYEPRECTYEGECTGTCPFCEKEAAELMVALKKKEAEGAEIKKDNVGILAIELGINECDSKDSQETDGEDQRIEIVLKGAYETLVDDKESPQPPIDSFRGSNNLFMSEKDLHELRKHLHRERGPLMGDIPSLEEEARLKIAEKARRRKQEVDLKTKIERYPNFEQYLSELTWIKIEDAEVLVPKTGFYLYKCLADNHTWYDLQCLHKGERLCEFFINHPYKRDVKPIEYYYVEESDKQFVLWGLSRLES